jgi:uncharacterized protein (TIGR00369 family)
MRSELNEIPFMRLLGAELVRAVDGEAEIALTLADEHMNSWGVGHGGVVMSLLDVAMARQASPGSKPSGAAGSAASRSR